ncbi:MAG: hypothetical protein LBB90_08585, partial [Tannerella sp.]|nr:hypothetical protein [Tannerella sp.]
MNKFKKTEMRTANKFARYLLAGIAGCICLFSCDIIDDIFDNDKDGKSSSKVEKAYQKIKETADEILLSDDPIGGFEAMAEEYRTMDEVEKVEARTDGLFIKFSDERVCVWFVPPDLPTSFIEPASVLEKMEIRASAKSGNGKILLINQQKGEPDREYNDQLISALNHVYTNSSNWTSSIVGGTDGSDVTLDFIRN